MADLEPSKPQNQILQGNSAFTSRLYQILSRKPGNLFFSPLSIHAVIAMAHQGAKEETAKTIEEILQLPEAKISALGYQTVTKHLKSLEDVLVYLAFKIYFRKDVELDEEFVGNVQKYFSSDVESVDFGEKEQVVNDINQWVEKQTAEKIKNIASPSVISEDTVMLLINALYFKGDWRKKFRPTRTTVEKFYVDEENAVDVQMMHEMQDELYKFDEELKAQVLQLRFKDVNARMVVVLPKDRNGIGFVENKLSSVGLSGLVENLSQESVELALPKFKMETTMDLSGALTEIGLGNIFSKKANFNGMLKSPSNDLCVAKVLQKTFIDVNESGVEAAAVTRMQLMKKKGKWVEEPVSFVVDHPAVFLLVVDLDGTMNVLFCGRLSSPSY